MALSANKSAESGLTGHGIVVQGGLSLAKRINAMAWTITKVQPTGIPTGDILPGFNLQQEGRSPSVTFAFESEARAEEGRKLMERLLDISAAIVHIGR